MPNDFFYDDARDAAQDERDEQAERHIEEVKRAEAYIARQRYLGAWDLALAEDAERSRQEVLVA